MLGIGENIAVLREEIGRQLLELGRAEDDCLMVAVTKTHSAAQVLEALQAGACDIGENKLQEASLKLPELEALLVGSELKYRFHFIGHLQKNKVKQLLLLQPQLIHSVDSYALAERISRIVGELNQATGEARVQEILIQLNCSGEDSKSGMKPSDAKEAILQIAELENIRIRGLMTIGLLAEDPREAAPGFRMLKGLFDELKAYENERLQMKWLSMGMTDDYKIALSEGSNLLRIGSAIFGQRDYGEST